MLQAALTRPMVDGTYPRSGSLRNQQCAADGEDVFAVSGFLEIGAKDSLRRIVLSYAAA